jgi:hypothetical protein
MAWEPRPEDENHYIRNVGYAMVAGQSGCSTAVMIIGALLLGLWLDSLFGTRPAFTLLLTISSVPLSLMLMLYTVLGAARRLPPPKVKPKDTSARPSGEDDAV